MLAIVSSGREPFARPLQAALQALVAIARTAPHLEAERAVLRGALALARFAERPGGVKALDGEYRDACHFLAQTGNAEPWANGRIQEVLAALPGSDDDDGLEPALAGGGGPEGNPPMQHEASMEAEATDEEALAAWSVVAQKLLSSERATA